MIDKIFEEIRAERIRQHEKWGEQNWPMVPDNFGYFDTKVALGLIRRHNDKAGKKDWYSILAEEFLEAFVETDPKREREEMIHVAAVAVQIIQCLDRHAEIMDAKQ